MLNYHQASFIKSALSHRALPDDTGAEIAFLGRSNAGKSSALNRLTRKGLARTSKTPGRTQHLNVFSLDEAATYRLVDLPGYGFSKTPKAVHAKWPPMINDYLAHRQSLRGLVLMLDSRHPPKPTDIQVINWCIGASLPIHIVATKIDKLSRGAAQAARLTLEKLFCTRSDTASTEVTVQLFSAKSGQGLDELRKQLDSWLEG